MDAWMKLTQDADNFLFVISLHVGRDGSYRTVKLTSPLSCIQLRHLAGDGLCHVSSIVYHFHL